MNKNEVHLINLRNWAWSRQNKEDKDNVMKTYEFFKELYELYDNSHIKKIYDYEVEDLMIIALSLRQLGIKREYLHDKAKWIGKESLNNSIKKLFTDLGWSEE